MKYFTPELFARTQNLADDAALGDWERATAAYTASLRTVSGHFPRPLRRIVEEFHLHDADVLSMSRAGDILSITLQQEPPDGSLLILTYTLVDGPHIDRFALPEECRTDYAAWLYDEIGIDEPLVEVPLFTHHILLSNGWEIGLRFRKVKLSRPEALLPPPHTGGERECLLPHSA